MFGRIIVNAVLADQGIAMDEDTLKSLASDLAMAAQCLRHAWATMKRNGMENTAKELADTVLDVETAAEEINFKFSTNNEIETRR